MGNPNARAPPTAPPHTSMGYPDARAPPTTAPNTQQGNPYHISSPADGPGMAYAQNPYEYSYPPPPRPYDPYTQSAVTESDTPRGMDTTD